MSLSQGPLTVRFGLNNWVNRGGGWMAAGHRTDRRLRGRLSGRRPLAWGRCENNDGSPPQFGFY